jgi:group I intron endonuclease
MGGDTDLSYAPLPLGYKAILYRVTNLANGKTYIGITTKGLRKRFKVHRDAAGQGRGAVIGAAIRKYGKDNFHFETLIVCPTWEYAKEMECRCIAAFRPEYNLTAGGDGCLGYKHTPASLKRLSEANKGKKKPPKPPTSEEYRKKMSEARYRYWAKRPHSRKSYLKNGPRRGIMVLDGTGTVYESIMHAARSHGLTRENVRSALRVGGQFKVWGGLQT